MVKQELQITDKRMLQIMDYCISNKINDVDSISAWCDAIGFARNNMFNVKTGLQRFGIDHIQRACEVFNISADYVFGFTDKMYRGKKGKSALERIKEAVNELEQTIENPA